MPLNLEKQYKVVCFDMFGTLFDMSDVPREEISEYIKVTRKEPWEKLELPESWLDLNPFPDVEQGFKRMDNASHFDFYILSNAPYVFTIELLIRNDLEGYGFIIPLEQARLYKPKPETYWWASGYVTQPPEDVLMVSGNKGYEQCEKIGMDLQLIRHDGCPADLVELVKLLRC